MVSQLTFRKCTIAMTTSNNFITQLMHKLYLKLYATIYLVFAVCLKQMILLMKLMMVLMQPFFENHSPNEQNVHLHVATAQNNKYSWVVLTGRHRSLTSCWAIPNLHLILWVLLKQYARFTVLSMIELG